MKERWNVLVDPGTTCKIHWLGRKMECPHSASLSEILDLKKSLRKATKNVEVKYFHNLSY